MSSRESRQAWNQLDENDQRIATAGGLTATDLDARLRGWLEGHQQRASGGRP